MPSPPPPITPTHHPHPSPPPLTPTHHPHPSPPPITPPLTPTNQVQAKLRKQREAEQRDGPRAGPGGSKPGGMPGGFPFAGGMPPGVPPGVAEAAMNDPDVLSALQVTSFLAAAVVAAAVDGWMLGAYCRTPR